MIKKEVAINIFLSGSGVQTGISENGILLDYNLDYESLNKDDSFFGTLAVRTGTNSSHIIVTSDDNMGVSPTKSLMIPNSGMTGGFSYDCYAFLCNKSLIDPSVIQTYYALEGGYIGTFVVYSSRIKVTLTGTKLPFGNGYRVDWELKLENISNDQPVTLNTNSIQVRYGDKEPTDSIGTGEGIQSLGNITIQPNTEETRSGFFNNVLNDYGTRGGGYLYYSNTSQTSLNVRFYI